MPEKMETALERWENAYTTLREVFFDPMKGEDEFLLLFNQVVSGYGGVVLPSLPMAGLPFRFEERVVACFDDGDPHHQYLLVAEFYEDGYASVFREDDMDFEDGELFRRARGELAHIRAETARCGGYMISGTRH